VPFRPYHDDHSIVEVAFQLVLDGIPTDDELRRIRERHPRWVDDLPSVKVNNIPAFAGLVLDLAGDMHVPRDPSRPLPSLEFASFRRDGVLDWRLFCAGAVITVNCLTYTRWNDVSNRALDYLSGVSATFAESDRRAAALLLQYSDGFVWEGSLEAYQANQLLDPNSQYLAPSIFEAGPLWHLHQGWLGDPTNILRGGASAPTIPGRLLQRINITSNVGPIPPVQPTPVVHVKIEHIQKYQIEPSIPLAGLFAHNGVGAACLSLLHDDNKNFMRNILSGDAAAGIHLDE
jgi:uncharacterized protein (TIGR04255 family)